MRHFSELQTFSQSAAAQVHPQCHSNICDCCSLRWIQRQSCTALCSRSCLLDRMSLWVINVCASETKFGPGPSVCTFFFEGWSSLPLDIMIQQRYYNAIRLYGYMAIWLYGYMAIWLYGYMAIRLRADMFQTRPSGGHVSDKAFRRTCFRQGPGRTCFRQGLRADMFQTRPLGGHVSDKAFRRTCFRQGSHTYIYIYIYICMIII